VQVSQSTPSGGILAFGGRLLWVSTVVFFEGGVEVVWASAGKSIELLSQTTLANATMVEWIVRI